MWCTYARYMYGLSGRPSNPNVAALASALLERLPQFTDELTERICQQVEAYQQEEPVPRDHLNRSCRQNLEFGFRSHPLLHRTGRQLRFFPRAARQIADRVEFRAVRPAPPRPTARRCTHRSLSRAACAQHPGAYPGRVRPCVVRARDPGARRGLLNIRSADRTITHAWWAPPELTGSMQRDEQTSKPPNATQVCTCAPVAAVVRVAGGLGRGPIPQPAAGRTRRSTRSATAHGATCRGSLAARVPVEPGSPIHFCGSSCCTARARCIRRMVP